MADEDDYPFPEVRPNEVRELIQGDQEGENGDE